MRGMASGNQAPLARRLDHCVLPTAGLADARERLTALGFTVAPDAAHPFGTGNCCVFFGDGAYLEPLAVVDAAAARAAIDGGNVFVARDAAFRAAAGEEGFSAVVLGTTDAAADHARFAAGGISAGPPLAFSRPFIDAAGAEAVASFRLAFAVPAMGGDRFFFTCERVNAPKIDRAALERHANGVSGIARIVAVAAQPDDARAFLERFSGQELASGEAGDISLPLAGSSLSLMTSASFAALYGVEPSGAAAPLDFAAIVFRVPAFAALRSQLAANRVAFSEHGGRIVVPPATGQGALFIFEEFSA